MDRESALQRDFVPISPGECVALPIEIYAIPFRQQYAQEERDVSSGRFNCAVFDRCSGCLNDAIPALHDKRPGFCIVQIKHGHTLQFDQWPQVQLDTRPNCRLLWVSPLSIVLGLKIQSDVRI